MSGSLRHSKGAMTPEYTTLSGTSAESVFTSRKGGAIINEIVVSNPTGSAVTCTVDVHDGTSTLFELMPAVSVASKTVKKIDLDGWPMMANHTIRVTGAASIQVAVNSYRNIYENNQNFSQ